MDLSIRTGGNNFRTRSLDQLAALQQRQQERLASGRRIARAADDSAGLAIARRLEAAVRGTEQGERNVADGQSLARIAEGSLQSSQDTLGRMRELSIQAQNGTLSNGDRSVIQQEFDQLAMQLNQTASSVNFGGRNLLDGSASGGDAIAISDGNGGSTAIEIADASAAALGVQGLDVGNASTIDALDSAQGLLASERARLGSLDNTFTRQLSQLSSSRINQEEARSRIEDVDVARAVAESTRDRILMDLTLAGQRMSDHSRGRVLDLLS